jgi:hypothetical protein
MTFGKRYALCNALGIVTAEEDTDVEEKEEPNKAFNKIKASVDSMDIKKLKEINAGIQNSDKYDKYQKAELNKLVKEKEAFEKELKKI